VQNPRPGFVPVLHLPEFARPGCNDISVLRQVATMAPSPSASPAPKRAVGSSRKPYSHVRVGVHLLSLSHRFNRCFVCAGVQATPHPCQQLRSTNREEAQQTSVGYSGVNDEHTIECPLVFTAPRCSHTMSQHPCICNAPDIILLLRIYAHTCAKCHNCPLL